MVGQLNQYALSDCQLKDSRRAGHALCGAAVGVEKLGSQTKFGVVGRNCLSARLHGASFSAHSQFKPATRKHPAGDSLFFGYFLWRRKESNLLSGKPRRVSFKYVHQKMGSDSKFLAWLRLSEIESDPIFLMWKHLGADYL